MNKSEKIWQKFFFYEKIRNFLSYDIFDTILDSYCKNKIRYIIKPDGRMVWKIITGECIWCLAQVMVSRDLENPGGLSETFPYNRHFWLSGFKDFHIFDCFSILKLIFYPFWFEKFRNTFINLSYFVNINFAGSL